MSNELILSPKVFLQEFRDIIFFYFIVFLLFIVYLV